MEMSSSSSVSSSGRAGRFMEVAGQPHLTHTCYKTDTNAVERQDWYFGEETYGFQLTDMVMDYLIHGGFSDIIDIFCEEAGIPRPNLEMENITYRECVRKAINNGKIDKAMQLLGISAEEWYVDKNIDFRICLQYLLELIRKGKAVEALQFSDDCLLKRVQENPSYRSSAEEAFTLLAFSDPVQSPLGKLLDRSNRELISYGFNSVARKSLPYVDHLIRYMCWYEQQVDNLYPLSLAEGLDSFMKHVLCKYGMPLEKTRTESEKSSDGEKPSA